MSEPMIVVENLSKVFGDDPKKAINLIKSGMTKDEILEETGLAVGVQDASFEVQRGEIFVVMGLSGSGKSTLIRCLNRLIEPTEGTVSIDGQEVTAMNEDELRELRRRKTGMVFQRFALFPHKTVLQNAAFGLEIQGMKKEEREELAAKALEFVGLQGWEDNMPDQLSGGMQQRVGLARALAIDPAILLMDEAFSALDPLIRSDLQDELLELQGKMNKTIVFITHDLNEALKIGDRVALMKDGAIVQIGTPEEILTSPADEYVARFVEGVDMSKVLTAEGVMKSPRAVARPKDGPGVALKKMQEASISSIFVVDSNRVLQGIVTAQDAGEALKKNEHNLENIMVTDIPTVEPDRPLNQLFALMAEKKFPLAVVDEQNRLKGVVVNGAVIAGLVREDFRAQAAAHGSEAQ